jgi:hypothetical protein
MAQFMATGDGGEVAIVEDQLRSALGALGRAVAGRSRQYFAIYSYVKSL